MPKPPPDFIVLKNATLEGSDGNVLLTEGQQSGGMCTVCRQIGSKACGKCGLDSYCGRAHQREDWPRHKALVCNASPEDKERLRQRLWHVDVNDDAMDAVGEGTDSKEAAVRKVERCGCRRLLTVICNNDPAWVERLLRAAAPLLEELELWNPQPAHWALLATMPRLYRLELNNYICFEPEGLSPMPPMPKGPPAPAGLQWLRTCLSEQATVEIVRAHAHTLREWQLFVGTETHHEHDPLVPTRPWWPWKCSVASLASLVSRCGALPALRRLVLRRPYRPVWTLGGDFAHSPHQCHQQRQALRALLPAEAAVLCGECDNVKWGCFKFTIFGLW